MLTQTYSFASLLVTEFKNYCIVLCYIDYKKTSNADI